MNWEIPPPYPVPDVKPLRWNAWWHGFSLVSIAIVLVGAGGWFWLKEGRILLYTFGVVIAWCLICGVLAGWMLFRFGVDEEHAEGVREYNQMQEVAWQRWAQSGLPVLAKSCVFPPEIPAPSRVSPPVVNNEALSPGDYPGHAALITELVIPLLGVLQVFLRQHRLEVYLPENIPARDFYQAWETLGLPETVLDCVVPADKNFFPMISRWAEETAGTAGRLMICSDWENDAQHTQGAAAWLIGPCRYHESESVLCTLHRPMCTASDTFTSAAQQFMHYQPIAQTVSDLWVNEQAQPYIAELMIQRASYLRANQLDTMTPPLEQQYIPHWLGKVSEESPWFAVTLMMQMAECHQGTQILLHSRHNELMLFTISAGEFSDD